MNKTTVAIAFSFALATMFVATARAEMGGQLINDKGQCRQLGPNNQNQMYYYWAPCPTNLASENTAHVHPERVTPGAMAAHSAKRHHKE